MKNIKASGVISFRTLRIEGFCTISKTLAYPLNYKGITIIRGKNGIGKTTIPSALVWALYGVTLKKSKSVETWKDLQPKSYQGTKVEVDFKYKGSVYTIIRCHKYKGIVEGIKGDSRLLILKDGEYQQNFRDKNDVQEEVERLLGYSSNLFKNTIVFGQKLTRLISETGPIKKKLFEEAFEIGWVEIAKEHGEKEYQEAVKLKAVELSKISTLESRLENLTKELETKENTLQTQQNEEKAQIEKIEKSISDTTAERITLAEGKTQLLDNPPHDEKTLNQEYRGLNDEIQSLVANIAVLKAQWTRDTKAAKQVYQILEADLNHLTRSLIENACPTCKAPYDIKSVEVAKKRRSTAIANKSQELLATRIKMNEPLPPRVAELEEQLDNKKSLLKKLDNKKDELSKHQRRISSIDHSIAIQDNSIEHLTKALEEAKASKFNFIKLSIKNDKAEKVEIETTLLTMNKGLKIISNKVEAFKWVIQEALSNKGIKAYVFSTMMARINAELLKYSTTLGFRVKFDIDLLSARKDFETTIFQGTVERDYDDLSGGQQQLVDCAIAFAMHDTMYTTRPVDLLFLDEIFESLDEDNVDKVVELVRVKTKDIISCHIISHKKDFSVINSREAQLKQTKQSLEILI